MHTTEPLAQEIIDSLPGHKLSFETTRVPGGDSHRALFATLDHRPVFIKFNDAGALPQFEAEKHSLEVLQKADCLQVPNPISTGVGREFAWLIVEKLELCSRGDAHELGEGLAALHRVTADAHGWSASNFIGAMPQANHWEHDWATFFWKHRLAPQFQRSRQLGFAPCLDPLEQLFRDNLSRWLSHEPVPSLLHGDLWCGNHGYTRDGHPVVFDPACHFGDRECDLAMMTLFGGFHPEVLTIYEAVWPLAHDHELRRIIYQFYHLMNHLNLFGRDWLGRVTDAGKVLSRRAGSD